MVFERKHRLSKRALRRPTAAPFGGQLFRRQAEGIVVQDFDGTDVFRTGAYGTDVGQDDTRGFYMQDSSGNSIMELNSEQGVSLGDPIIGQVQSDNIVTVSADTVQQFIDFTNGDDGNDGLAPKPVTDAFAATGNVDGSTMTGGYYTWNIIQGTAANATYVAGPAMQFSNAASTNLTALAGVGSMFDEQKVNVQMNKTPTSAAARAHIFFRALDKGSWSTNQQAYCVRFAVAAGGGVPTITILTVVDGTFTAIYSATACADGLSFAANTDWTIRAQCYYNYSTKQTTIRAKAWRADGTETSAWTHSVVNSTNELNQRGGRVGLCADMNAIGNGPILTKFSSWSYNQLDPDLIASDDSSTTASDLYYTPSSSSGPVASLSAAMRSVPPYMGGYNFINFFNFADTPTENSTHIDGYVGGGELYIVSAGCTIGGGLSFNGNATFIHMGGLQFSDTGGGTGLDAQATVTVNTSRHLEIFDCRIQSNSISTILSNILFIQGAEGNVYRTQMNGAASQCINAQEGSMVRCQDNLGAGTNSYKANASVIFTAGSAPTGGTTTLNAGKVFASGTADVPASTGGGNSGPTSTSTTYAVNANGSGTYGLAYGTWASGDLDQGSYGGGQNHKSLWHYPSGLQSKLHGNTITAMYITIRRASNSGSSGAETIYLCSFDTSNVNSGNPGNPLHGPTAIGTLAWGQTKTFRVPSAMADDLKTAASTGGGCVSLGVYTGSGNPYLTLLGVNHFPQSGRIKVTYHS